MGEAARRLGLLTVLLAAFALGCAGMKLGWDGVIPLDFEVAAQPDDGALVRLALIDDQRVFQKVSHARTTPSIPHALWDDETIRARVIGRRRENQGGSLLVPAGEFATTWVERAMISSLRQAGRRVETDSTDDAPADSDVTVTIRELWAFVVPSGGTLKFEMRIRLGLDGKLPPFDQGLEVCGRSMRTAGGEAKVVWNSLVRDAFADLVAKSTSRIQRPGGAPDLTCTPSHE